jgi:ABC-2 type transport system ATP-binding protein
VDEVAISVDGLHVRRGNAEVLRDLTVTVPRGQVVGLLGPSGSGKTTLMRCVVGVQKVAAGTVTVLGEPAGSRGLRRRIGYVTQASSVYGDLTVRENLRYFARVLDAPASDVDRAIDETGLGGQATRLAGSLSGGQLGRVSLAAALLGAPELLVLDEPTVGLDPLLRTELWELFHRLADAGTSIFVSSHVMDEATRCDRLLLLRDGELIADDTPAGMLRATGTADAESAFLAIIREREGRRHPRAAHRAGGAE